MMFNSSRLYTHVLSFNIDRYILGVQYALQLLCNLDGQAFLNLRTTSIIVYNAIELGQTNDIPIGNIGNMRFANNRLKMMFTMMITETPFVSRMEI